MMNKQELHEELKIVSDKIDLIRDDYLALQ